jgi:hypothetical protein
VKKSTKKAPAKKPAKKATQKTLSFEAGLLTLNVSAIANTEQQKLDAKHLLEQIASVAATFGLHVSPPVWMPASYLVEKIK